MANRAAALMALAQTHGAAIAVQTPDMSISFADLAAQARNAAGGLAGVCTGRADMVVQRCGVAAWLRPCTAGCCC